MVGPTGIGYDVVRMTLRPAATPGERVITHPLRSFPFWLAWSPPPSRSTSPVNAFGVDYNLDRHDTLVNASTGKLLADYYGGALSGDPVKYALFNSNIRPWTAAGAQPTVPHRWL